MPIKSNLHWVAYKEVVASSAVKSLEVFASKVVKAPLFHVDLNQTLVDDVSPVSSVPPIVEHKVEAEANEYPQYEFGGSAPMKDYGDDSDEEYERHRNIFGDVEAEVRHQDMDPDIIYQRACVDDSDDEGPVNELDEDGLTKKEAEWYTKITGRDHKIPLFCDVSLADKAIVDGGMSKAIEARQFPSSTPDAISMSYVRKGLMFEHMLEFRMWLCEYAMKHHRPFIVVHSDCNKRYTVKCEVERCKWKVNGRLTKDGWWKITSCKATHQCTPPAVEARKTHRQLTSEFIGYKYQKHIAEDPTIKVKLLMSWIEDKFGYKVKYGKTWKAKQVALRMLYGGWEEAYNMLPRLLGAMSYRNPGMYHYVQDIEGVFRRAFWTFGPCIAAFEHCRPVLSIDGTFLTGKYKGTLMIAMAHDANDQVLPVAFALVSVENQDNWEWFMRLVRSTVIPPNREVCIISDRHQGILKAVIFIFQGMRGFTTDGV
ncbi:uncharacterized protein [Aegilops tauschii subsp. strangulata]|uniref:uncharacterized protein n=1 Tax=Aegilops tauschii subsp. strangulata TaxID=200361 RepID=UPI001ABCCC8C|nr:uncharacterized protein LOC109755419 [Aegilops tauschii subsp. strangulata]